MAVAGSFVCAQAAHTSDTTSRKENAAFTTLLYFWHRQIGVVKKYLRGKEQFYPLSFQFLLTGAAQNVKNPITHTHTDTHIRARRKE